MLFLLLAGHLDHKHYINSETCCVNKLLLGAKSCPQACEKENNEAGRESWKVWSYYQLQPVLLVTFLSPCYLSHFPYGCSIQPLFLLIICLLLIRLLKHQNKSFSTAGKTQLWKSWRDQTVPGPYICAFCRSATSPFFLLRFIWDTNTWFLILVLQFCKVLEEQRLHLCV